MAISKVSFSRTPQAQDDTFVYSENAFTTSISLDVMANDLGGAAKRLYSIDDGSGTAANTSALPGTLTLCIVLSVAKVPP